MRNWWNDFAFGVRTELRTPGATAAIVLTLAFGIAANAVAFSLVNSLFVRPLPVRQPEQLVRIYSSAPGGIEYFTVSYGDYTDIRALRDRFSGVAIAEPVPLTLGVGGTYERLWGERVSTEYFSVLGVAPAAGRLFGEEDSRPGALPVGVISHGLWQRAFAGRAVINEPLIVDGERVTIVGVLPERFHGTHLGLVPHIWLPVVQDRELLSARGGGRYFVLARLQPDVTVADARVALDVLGRRLEQTYATNRGVRFTVLPESGGRIHPVARGGILGFSAVFVGVAVLLLVAACSNVAAVLIARALSRRQEIAIRLALGATRGRIIRLLLIESGTLSAAAGFLGVTLAWIAVRTLNAVPLPAARGAPIGFDFGLDARVLAFGVLVTVFSAILFGLAPALVASRRDVLPALRNAATSSGMRPAHLRDALIGAQVGVSIVLLMIGGLFLRNLEVSRRIDPGFDTRGVVVASVDLAPRGAAAAGSAEYWRRLVERIAAIPGADAVTLADRVPFEVNITVMRAAAAGRIPLPAESWPPINYAIVDARYFETLRIPVVRGREFDARDSGAARPVVVVNDVLARRFWPDADAVGQRVVQPDGTAYEVIGVVRRLKYLTLGEEPLPYLYRPLAQSGGRAMTIVARTTTDTAAFLRELRTSLRAFDESAAVYNIGTLDDRMRMARLPATSGAAVTLLMSGVSLLLTAVGLYGAVAFAVGRRTWEIGVRRALGAKTGHIMRLVLQRVLLWGVTGASVGAVAGLIASQALRSLLFDVRSSDPLILAAAPIVLLLVCAIASLIPASRALRIEPAVALRHE